MNSPQVRYIDSRGTARTQDLDLFASERLSKTTHSGAAERAAEQAENNSRAIGRILEFLFERGIMTGEEALRMVDEHNATVARPE